MKLNLKIYLTIILLSSIVSLADEINIGTNWLKMHYVETDKNNVFLDSEISEFSDINGFYGSYRKDFGAIINNKQVTSLEASIRTFKGSTTYDGYLQSVNTGQILAPYTTTTNNEIFESKLRLQQTKYTKNYDVGVFTSYGYREWTRDIQGSFPLKEIYEWQYFDIGLDIITYDGPWEAGVEIAYQRAVNPTMTAYLNSPIRFELGKVDGYYYKFPIGYNFDKNYKLEISYEYNHWDIEASNIVGGFYEPDSRTQNKIFNIGFTYRF